MQFNDRLSRSVAWRVIANSYRSCGENGQVTVRGKPTQRSAKQSPPAFSSSGQHALTRSFRRREEGNMTGKSVRGIFMLVLWLTGMPAYAQDYPTRPITLIVSFSAGGPIDSVARQVA